MIFLKTLEILPIQQGFHGFGHLFVQVSGSFSQIIAFSR
jgi:hypothetical protein